jgi:hypothetical protein
VQELRGLTLPLERLGWDVNDNDALNCSHNPLFGFLKEVLLFNSASNPSAIAVDYTHSPMEPLEVLIFCRAVCVQVPTGTGVLQQLILAESSTIASGTALATE